MPMTIAHDHGGHRVHGDCEVEGLGFCVQRHDCARFDDFPDVGVAGDSDEVAVVTAWLTDWMGQQQASATA